MKNVVMVKVENLCISPNYGKIYQVENVQLELLCDSITKNGVQEPIIVTHDNLIVHGVQRWLAFKELGILEIPARVLDITVDVDQIFQLVNFNRNGNVFAKVFQEFLNYFQNEPSKAQLFDGFRKRAIANDTRIVLPDLEMNYVEDCFMELALDKNGRETGESFIDESDIKYFLQANFSNFGEPIPRKLIQNTFKSKTHLSNYIGEIFKPLLSEKKYFLKLQNICDLLTENFIGFQNQSNDSIQKALRREADIPPFLSNARLRHHKFLRETSKKL